MSDAEFVMREVVDGVTTETPITREEMFGTDERWNMLAERHTAAHENIYERIIALEAQMRELQRRMGPRPHRIAPVARQDGAAIGPNVSPEYAKQFAQDVPAGDGADSIRAQYARIAGEAMALPRLEPCDYPHCETPCERSCDEVALLAQPKGDLLAACDAVEVEEHDIVAKLPKATQDVLLRAFWVATLEEAARRP